MKLEPTLPAIAPERAGDPATLGEYEGFVVYPMPVFVTLPACDVVASARWYVDALGFGVMYVGPDVNGQPMLVHLRRRKYQDVLLVPTPDAPATPGGGVSLSMAADGELDALAQRAAAAVAVGVSAVEGPQPTPWGARQLLVTDPDGYRLTLFDQPSKAPAGDIDDVVRKSAPR